MLPLQEDIDLFFRPGKRMRLENDRISPDPGQLQSKDALFVLKATPAEKEKQLLKEALGSELARISYKEKDDVL